MYFSRMGWGVEEDVEIVGDENLYCVLQNVVTGVEPGERREHVFVKGAGDGPRRKGWLS